MYGTTTATGILAAMTEERRYQTTVKNVEEVTLFGSAELSPWEERLAADGLRPHARDGRAEIMIVACTARYMGIRFRELSVSISLDVEDSACLAQAYNSVRLFAWFERKLFKTPYVHADVTIETEPLPRMGVFHDGTRLLAASMAERPQAAVSDGGWEGTVHLPRRGADVSRLFHVRLRGSTQVVRYSAEDAFDLSPRAADDTLQMLVDSGFQPAEWHIRRGATHARSKTYTTAAQKDR